MSSLGIPGNLQASCGESGIINLSWVDTPPSCNPAFSVSSGNVDEIVKSSQKTWTLNNSLGTVTWGITGTGASITQGGVVTTTGAACGTLTITATDSCCGVYTQQVRVTDGGVWVLTLDLAFTPGGTTCGACGPQTGVCEVISGNTKKYYAYHRACWVSRGACTGKCAEVGACVPSDPCVSCAYPPCDPYGVPTRMYHNDFYKEYIWSCP